MLGFLGIKLFYIQIDRFRYQIIMIIN